MVNRAPPQSYIGGTVVSKVGTMKITDPRLLRQQCYLGGAWSDADDAATLEDVMTALGAEEGP